MNLKPHQIIPASGFRIQTTLHAQRIVPTGINLEEDDGTHLVSFEFDKLMYYFFQHYLKHGHWQEICEEDILPVALAVVQQVKGAAPLMLAASLDALPPPAIQTQQQPLLTDL